MHSHMECQHSSGPPVHTFDRASTPSKTMTQTLYISTFKGNRFYPLEGRIDQIDIEDIAHGLAFQCRFNGQTSSFYSVAQHSLMVARLVPKNYYKAALLHDAAEAYLGDVVKPLKAILGDYGRIEAVVTSLIGQAFSVSFEDDGSIKKADWIALATEKRDLLPNSTEPWSYLEGIEAEAVPLVPMGPLEAKTAFLSAWFDVVDTSPKILHSGRSLVDKAD